MQNIKETTHPNIHLAVQNFGPIARAEIDLRPLTVFVGESNTGKTYLAALIYALHRTFLLCHCHSLRHRLYGTQKR